MAKSKAKKQSRFESVGWGFWLITFVLLYPACWYIVYDAAYADQKRGVLPWGLGFFLAAIGASIVSIAVNFVLQKRIELQKKRAKRKRS